MSIVVFISLFLCINADRRYSSRRYAPRQTGQRPREQMRSNWNRQYAQQGGYGSVHHENHYAQSPHPQYSYKYGKGSKGFGNAQPINANDPVISSTENIETTSTTSYESSESTELYGSTEESVVDPTSNEDDADDEIDDDYDVTNTNEPVEPFTPEPGKESDQQPLITNCLHDKCFESFNACFNDQQCKDILLDWTANKSLRSECLATIPSLDTITNESPKIQQVEEYETFETTEGKDFDTSSNTESTILNTESTMTEDFESTEDEPKFEASSETTEVADDHGFECGYPELFWDVYNCGVDNYCYTDQLKLAQSHQYLISRPSNESKSSVNNWTLLMVAVTSGIAAIIIFEVLRRLYIAFQYKIRCECDCKYVSLNHSLRYLKNKWEQIRGYKYEKTHHDLDVMEESDDAEMYERGSDQDESIIDNKDTTGVTYNGPMNDSDSSDDEELQKTSSIIVEENEKEQKDEEEEEEIAKEPVQEL